MRALQVEQLVLDLVAPSEHAPCAFSLWSRGGQEPRGDTKKHPVRRNKTANNWRERTAEIHRGAGVAV